MDAEFNDNERLIQLLAETCGTAGCKTIHFNVSRCELSIKEAEDAAKLIMDAVNWLKNERYNPYDPDCVNCPIRNDIERCPLAKQESGDR
jgi:hypothetical protein